MELKIFYLITIQSKRTKFEVISKEKKNLFIRMANYFLKKSKYK